MAITFPSTAELTSRLDEIEARLPAIPARIMKLQRAVSAAYYDRTVATINALTGSTSSFLSTARTSGKTVTGQARAAAGDVAANLRTNVNTVTGQAAAQGKRVARAAESETTKLVDGAIDAVESDLDEAIEDVQDAPGSGTPYEEWTKADLVERAKQLKIVGPTRMSKAELIVTLRNA